MADDRLLDPSAVSQAEALAMDARFIVEGFLSGQHKSPFHGFSVEFTQHREYVPGDDLRHLDWKVLSRTDRYYIRQYEQETNLHCQVLLDTSESMLYGSTSLRKIDYARKLAACLCYLVLHQRDAVSLTLFDQALQTHVPRSGSMGAMLPVMAALASAEPTGQTDVGAMLHHAAAMTARRGIVVLISDVLDDEQLVLDGVSHLRFSGHEVVVIHVMDPFELRFPFDGAVEFVGYEQASTVSCRPGDVRKTYLEELEAYRRNLIAGLEKHQCHYVLADTGRPLGELLSGYLAFRQRTRRIRVR